MKKALKKKLVLSRETVRALAEHELSIPGGTQVTYPTICGCGTTVNWSCFDNCVPDTY
jgi:hypothetical protein